MPYLNSPIANFEYFIQGWTKKMYIPKNKNYGSYFEQSIK